MTIQIPNGRTISLEAKAGGGFQSVGLPDGSAPGPLTMDTPTKTATSITGVVIDGDGSTSYEHRVDAGTWTSGLTASGLTAETLYSMEWRGVNEFGTGPATTPVNVTTDAAGSTGFTGTNGETLTLTGSGFGAIADPRPTAKDNFNDYGLADGQEVPQGGASDNWGGNLPAGNDGYVLDDAVTLPGRTFSAKSISRKSQLKQAKQYSGAPSRAVSTYFGDFWFRHNEDLSIQPQSIDSMAHKLMRVWDDPSQNMTRVTFETRKNWCTSETVDGIWCSTDPASDGVCTVNDRYIFTTGASAWTTPNTWHHLQLAIYDDSNGEFFLNGKSLGLMPHFRKSPEASAVDWFTEVIGTDVGVATHLNSAFRQWLGEFIEQASPARVELRSSAARTEASEQTRWTQYLKTWSDTEITLDAYYGDLNTSNPIYADIIKADGTVIDWGQIN